MVDDGGRVVVVGGVIPSLRQDGRVSARRSSSLINILQIELMKVLMKTGTSNVEKVPGCCPGVPPWWFGFLRPSGLTSRQPSTEKSFLLIKLWLLSSSFVVVILILIVDVHVSEFRYLVDTCMIRVEREKGNLVQSNC